MSHEPTSPFSVSRGAPLGAAALALLLAGPLTAQEESGGDSDVHESARHHFRVVTVAEGLETPWSMTWLPSGDMLVTERPGRLRVVRDGELDPEPVAGVPEVRARGQGGLFDVLLHPDFEANRSVYLSFAKPNEDASESTTAVVRGRLSDDLSRLEGVEEVFEARAWAEGTIHYGARMFFDDEGYLFLSVGDRGGDPDLLGDQEAQNPSNHIGTVVRLHDDGSVPDDNPFVDDDDVLPEVWSYGHRNPQGLTRDPVTGRIWENEHGPRGGDELNLIRPGLNYGWPVASYGINYDGTIYTLETHLPGMVQPVWAWVPSIATSGLMVYTGDRFPWWRGNVFSGGLDGRVLSRITLDGERVVSEEELMEEELGRIRDVRQGPDGYIYVAVEDRRGGGTPIVRLEPVESRIQLPTP